MMIRTAEGKEVQCAMTLMEQVYALNEASNQLRAGVISAEQENNIRNDVKALANALKVQLKYDGMRHETPDYPYLSGNGLGYIKGE